MRTIFLSRQIDRSTIRRCFGNSDWVTYARAHIFPFLWASFLACSLAACGRLEDESDRQASSNGGVASGTDGDRQASSSGGVTSGTDGWTLKSDEEVESQFPCDEGSQRVGDLELRSLPDIEALAGVSEVVGTLHITGVASDLRPLHCLRTVTEDLRIYDAIGLHGLAGLEGLSAVQGAILIGVHCDGNRLQCSGNRDLATVVLPGLERTGRVVVGASCGGEGGPYCGPNAALYSVQMNRLEDVSDIVVGSNPALEEVRFESVAEMVQLGVAGVALHTLSIPELRTVEGLSLGRAPALEDVIAENLEATGDIGIGGTGLRDLSWLSVRSVAKLTLDSNSQLTSLHAFEQLESAVEVTLSSNSQLTSLHGLEQLEEVDRLSLIDNRALTTLDGLDGLRVVHGLLRISDMSALESLEGLNTLETVGGLTLEANEVLPNLQGLSSLVNVPDLTIQANPGLVSIEGMGALESVGDLSLRSNPMLTSVEGAHTLEIRERLDVYENPMLRSLRGLHGSAELSSVRLSGGALEDVEFMSGVFQVNSLEIDKLPQLQALSGLEALTIVESLSLSGNASLTDLSALGSLESIRRASIRSNRTLVSLAGLESLTQTEELYITDNAELRSLDALASLTSVEFGFRIENNPSLPTCAAEALVAQTQHNANLVTISGNDDAGVCDPP